MRWVNDGDMTPKERVHAAYRFEETDRCPVSTRHEALARRALGITLEEWARDGELSGKAQVAMTKIVGDDLLMAYIDTGVEADGFGQRTVFFEEEAPYAESTSFVISSPDDYYALEPYEVAAAPRIIETLKKVDVMVAELGETHAITGEPMEPFVTLGNLRGLDGVLMDCIRHPEAVKHGLEIVTDVEIAYTKLLVEHGCDVINVCWDYGNVAIMSEPMWMDLQGDCMKRFYQAIKDTGVWVSTHMCDSKPYVDAVPLIGNTDTIQNWAMPKGCSGWPEFKEKYGEQFSFTGGWNPVRIDKLNYDEVYEESKQLIRMLDNNGDGTGGGYVLSTSCEYPYNGPIINAIAMVDAAKDMAAGA